MPSSDVTRLLQQAGRGDRQALDRLFPLVYDELQRIASGQLRREHAQRTLLTQGLVHEAYLRLAGQEVDFRGRAHFLGVAGRVMRQVLVDAARRRRAEKRGGDLQRVTLSGIDHEPRPGSAPEGGIDLSFDEILALDEALDRLEELDPRLRRVVECRFFAGMSEEEIAGALDLSTRTVQRDWTKARAWLHQELEGALGAASRGNGSS